MTFSKVLILICFDLISLSSNLSWHFLYTWELLRCLFANLKQKLWNKTVLVIHQKPQILVAFPQFEIALFKPLYFLAEASLYLFLIIFAIDFPQGNLIQMINKKTKPIILTIMLILNNLIRNTFHFIKSSYCNGC